MGPAFLAVVVPNFKSVVAFEGCCKESFYGGIRSNLE